MPGWFPVSIPGAARRRRSVRLLRNVRRILWAAPFAALLVLPGMVSGVVRPPGRDSVPFDTRLPTDFYLAEEALDPFLNLSEESQEAGIVLAATPGASFFSTWGAYEVEHSFRFASDLVATVWLASDTAAVMTQFQVRVQKIPMGCESDRCVQTIATGSTGNAGDGTGIIDSDPLKFEVGVPVLGTTWEIGDQINVLFAVFGVGAVAAADVKILYGSVEHPSRLTVGVDDGGDFPARNRGVTAYLADGENLTYEAPTDEQDHVRVSENEGPFALASAPEWTWGRTNLTQDVVFGGDAVFSCWITTDGDVAALRGFRVLVTFTPPEGEATTVEKSIGVSTTNWVASSSVRVIAVGLNTAGLEFPNGTSVEILLRVFSTSNEDTGNVVILYGSRARPSGLFMPFEVPQPEPLPPLPDPLKEVKFKTAPTRQPGGSPPTAAPTASPSPPPDTDGIESPAGPSEDEEALGKDLRDAERLPSAGLVLAAAAFLVAGIIVRRRR